GWRPEQRAAPPRRFCRRAAGTPPPTVMSRVVLWSGPPRAQGAPRRRGVRAPLAGGAPPLRMSPPDVLPRLPSELMASVPPLIVVPPVYVLAPLRVWIPPVSVSPPVPWMMPA